MSNNYSNIDRYEEIKENVYGKELEEVVLNWKEVGAIFTCSIEA